MGIPETDKNWARGELEPGDWREASTEPVFFSEGSFEARPLEFLFFGKNMDEIHELNPKP